MNGFNEEQVMQLIEAYEKQCMIIEELTLRLSIFEEAALKSKKETIELHQELAKVKNELEELHKMNEEHKTENTDMPC